MGGRGAEEGRAPALHIFMAEIVKGFGEKFFLSAFYFREKNKNKKGPGDFDYGWGSNFIKRSAHTKK